MWCHLTWDPHAWNDPYLGPYPGALIFRMPYTKGLTLRALHCGPQALVMPPILGPYVTLRWKIHFSLICHSIFVNLPHLKTYSKPFFLFKLNLNRIFFSFFLSFFVHYV
jgi:hypothetical protein